MSPAPKKAKAAVAEKSDGGPRTVKWRGLSLEVPAVLPAEFAWAMADAEQSDRKMFAPLLNLVRAIIGEEQERRVRDKLTADEVPFADVPEVMETLVKAIFEAYGMAEGDSDASAQS